MDITPSASVDAVYNFEHGVCVLTHEPLDTQMISSSVGDRAAGATVVFIGTTRNSFEGKSRAPGAPSNLSAIQGKQ
jgi:molybdopterin synthase catalytic subunit